MRTLSLPSFALCLLPLTLGLAAGCEKSNPAPVPAEERQTATDDGGRAQADASSGAANPMTKAPEPGSAEYATNRLDSDMKVVIEALNGLGGQPIENLSPADARKQPTPTDAVKKVLETRGKPTTPEEVGNVEDKQVAIGANKLPVRIYTPKSGKAPYPAILYFHGGGWVIANNDVYDASARALANKAEAVVVAVDYRQAPEHKFPAAHDDAVASYQWLLKNAKSLKIDPNAIAVAGESAGGNLAANVSIAARDKKLKLPVHQLLVYPVAGTDMNTDSYKEFALAKPLNKAMISWFTGHYFRTPEDGKDTRINLVAADLKGLPPTTIVNAQIDVLRSEGELLAKKLEEAGVDVKQKTYDGVTHEFFGMGIVVDDAKDALGFGADRVKDAFKK